MLAASFVYTLSAALVKAIAPDFSSSEIVFFRSIVVALALLPVLRREGGLRALRTSRPLGHAARSALGFFGMITSFYGYAVLPLATAIALGFAMPLFITLLSVPLLGEAVGWRRGSAVLAGLGGVLLMVRPWDVGGDMVRVDAVLIVLAGVLAWAFSMITIRRLGAAGERNITIVMWFAIASILLSAVLALPGWVWPQGWQWFGLAGVGLISALAQMLMTEGYRSGETALVAPFEYGAIVYTTILGAAIWGEFPTPLSLLGIAILIASGLYIWRREAALGVAR